MEKKTKQPPEIKEDSYYVNIRRPIEIRRALLEASRSCIYSLKAYQGFLEKREEKLKELNILRVQMKEINLLYNKLREVLPIHTIRVKREEERTVKDIISHARIKDKKTKERFKPGTFIPRERTETEKLTDALEDIEGKLKGL